MFNLTIFRKYAKPTFFTLQYIALILLSLLFIISLAFSYGNATAEEVFDETIFWSNLMTFGVPIYFIFQLPLANINYAIEKRVKYYILTLVISLLYTFLDFGIIKDRAYEIAIDLDMTDERLTTLQASMDLVGYVLAGIYLLFTLLNYLFFRFALYRMREKYEKLNYLSKFFKK
jgi:hypothetical protein